MSSRIGVSLGDRYGEYELIAELPNRGRKRYFLCRCSCGREVAVRFGHLRSGHSVSCGCVKGSLSSLSSLPEYRIWKGMKRRCYRPKSRGYAGYGGRGIKVCDRWRESFENFLEDMGERPSTEYSIDRIDSDGDYEPGNCRWATRSEQSRNRNDNRILEFNGERMCLLDWARRYGMKKGTLHSRLSKGWTLRDALTQPVRSYTRQV